jgi:hypothetical protein
MASIKALSLRRPVRQTLHGLPMTRTFIIRKRTLCLICRRRGSGIIISSVPKLLSVLLPVVSQPVGRKFISRELIISIIESGMTAALKLVQYLIICRETGETPKFPSNELFYNFVDDCSYAVSIADMTIWATTTEQCKDEAFNHTNGDAFSWRYFYPRLGKYLGIHVRLLHQDMAIHLY